MTLLVGNIKDIPGAGANGFYRLDASDDAIAFRWRPMTATAIKKVEVIQQNTNSSPGDVNYVLTGDSGCAPIVAGGVPTDIGGGSPTLVAVASGSHTGSNARITASFTNAFTPTPGTFYWLVVYPSGTHDATNWRQIHNGSAHMSAARGSEVVAHGSALSTSPAWSRQSVGVNCVSFLDASDNYLQTITSASGFGFTFTWDNADNPDERGVAMDVPAGVRLKVHGFNSVYRPVDASADLELKCYRDSTQIGTTRTIDVSEWLPVYNTATVATTFWFADGPYTVDGPCTLRMMILPTHSSSTFTMAYWDFASQARRESMMLARDIWYTSRNDGGSFTDDKALMPMLHPYIEHVAPHHRRAGNIQISSGVAI